MLTANGFANSVTLACAERANDPQIMTAIEELAEPFQNGIEGMVSACKMDADALSLCGIVGIGYSRRKRAAFEIVTGCKWEAR